MNASTILRAYRQVNGYMAFVSELMDMCHTKVMAATTTECKLVEIHKLDLLYARWLRLARQESIFYTWLERYLRHEC